MLELYEGRCAYLAMRFHPALANPTVDHAIPKSQSWDTVYEWDNFRLCAAMVNSSKGADTLVDPFAVGHGWFALNPTTFHVERGAMAPVAETTRIDATLRVLNMRACVSAREEFALGFWHGAEVGGFDLGYLHHVAPFVALEFERLGLLVQVKSSWFELDLGTCELRPAPSVPSWLKVAIHTALSLLNQAHGVSWRKREVAGYLLGPTAKGYDLAGLATRAPFIASELRRQGQLVRGDV